MRIINIWVNNCLVSKDRDEIQKWLDNALKNHFEFKINWYDTKVSKMVSYGK